MDHTEALENHASERYLLGELSASEIQEFEEHYFGCADCAADLESATAFVANARAVFRREPEPERQTSASPESGWWGGWNRLLAGFRPGFAVAATSVATLALGAVCLYQAFVSIPRLKEAAYASNRAIALPSFALAGRARGDGATISIPRDSRYFAIYFDIDPQAAYPEYRCVLKDQAGSVRFTVRAAAPPAGQPITVLLPARELEAGKYDLVLGGLRGEREEAGISHYPFTLEFR